MTDQTENKPKSLRVEPVQNGFIVYEDGGHHCAASEQWVFEDAEKLAQFMRTYYTPVMYCGPGNKAMTATEMQEIKNNIPNFTNPAAWKKMYQQSWPEHWGTPVTRQHGKSRSFNDAIDALEYNQILIEPCIKINPKVSGKLNLAPKHGDIQGGWIYDKYSAKFLHHDEWHALFSPGGKSPLDGGRIPDKLRGLKPDKVWFDEYAPGGKDIADHIDAAVLSSCMGDADEEVVHEDTFACDECGELKKHNAKCSHLHDEINKRHRSFF